VLANGTTIPPRSEMDVVAKVICKDLREETCGMEWSSELVLLKPDVHVARTPIPRDRLDSIPFRVLNVLSKSVVMPAGTSLTELQPEQVAGSIADGHQVYDAKKETSFKTTLSPDNTDSLPLFIQQLIDKVHPSVPESVVLKLETILRQLRWCVQFIRERSWFNESHYPPYGYC
jgi:hypothetical protein